VRTLAHAGRGASSSIEHLRRSAQRLDHLSTLDSATSVVRTIARGLAAPAPSWAETLARAWRWLPTRYVPERTGDRWQRSTTTLRTGVGDCEDWSVLLAALLKASRLAARIAAMPLHVAVAIPVPAAELGPRATATRRGWQVHRHEGRAWVFLESTLPPGLRAAWPPGAGAEHIAAWAGTPYLQVAQVIP
jgi:transglutaminase-like putative cysteine protease